MRDNMHNKAAFTVVEVLIASAITAIVIIVAWTFYLIACNAFIDCSKRAPLQRKASLAVEKMVRGINGRYGIREGRAGSLNPVGSNRIEVDVDMNNPPTPLDSSDDTTISFYKSGDQLIYDPGASVIAEKVSNLTFTVSGSIVTINLGMQDTVRGKPINVGFSTKVMIRN